MINKAIKFANKVRPYILDMIWSNLNQGAITIASLVASIIFARLAGKELFGQYLSVLAMFDFLSIISIPGVGAVIFRTTAENYEGVYRKATTFSFFWSIAGVPIIIVTGIFFCLFKTKMLGLSLIICALFFPFVTSLKNWMPFLKGRSDFKKLTIYNLIKLLTLLAALIVSIVGTMNILIILLAYFLVTSGFNIFYHLKSVSSLKNNRLDPAWKKQGYLLTLLDLSGMIFGQVDILLVAALLSFEKVAIYGLVMKFTDVFFRIIKCTVETILPDLFKSGKISIDYFFKFFLVSFSIPICLYPLVKYPILWLYGSRYSEAIVFIQVYLAAIPFYFFNSLATSFLVKYKLNWGINIGRVVSIIFLIILYVILIPLYGLWGGVISSMLYFIIQLVINLLFLKNRKKYRMVF